MRLAYLIGTYCVLAYSVAAGFAVGLTAYVSLW